MELTEIELRLKNTERGLEKEVEKRERSDKYTHNVIEDVQTRYADIVSQITGIKSAFMQHMEDDKKMGLSIQGIDSRLRTVERLVWVAVGGIAVIAALIGTIGSHLITVLAK